VEWRIACWPLHTGSGGLRGVGGRAAAATDKGTGRGVNPLRGLAADSAYTASLLTQIDGPVLLAGYSYASAVITNAATSAPNVVGLVYVPPSPPMTAKT
jgi:pimeloyl-ACP methyl ester carboxylesterase